MAVIAELTELPPLPYTAEPESSITAERPTGDIIKRLKKPSIYTGYRKRGYIFSEDAEKMLDYTGCDAVMIARGAQGNPWIFKRTAHYLKTGELLPPPSPEERINTALRHAAELIRYKGEYIGVRQMRTHMAWYVKGVKGASSVRDKINHAENYEQIAEILNGIEY